MATKWVDLNNGMKYNPETGETYLKGKEANTYDYWYNPKTSQTTYGGKQFSGKLDPRILDSIGEDAWTSAYDSSFNNPDIQAQLAKIEKNPFIVGSEYANYGDAYAEKKYGAAFKPIQEQLDRLALSQAYSTAQKGFSGQSFFDELAGHNFSEPAPAGDANYRTPEQITNIQNNPNLSPEVKAALLGQQTETQAPQKSGDMVGIPTPVQEPAQSITPQQPTSPQAPTAPQQPQGPDWGALYEQISGYFTELQNKQSLGTPQKREQIGSFQQFSPTVSSRQQSYTSSAPYSSKGS
jgi:hypothetical protein